MKSDKLFSRFSKENLKKTEPKEIEIKQTTNETAKTDWRDKYQPIEKSEGYRLENSTDDSELNRMIQLKNVDNTMKSLGKPGQIIFDKTTSQAKLFINDTVGWVNFVTSNDPVALVPHLMQSDSTDQTIANVNNAQVVTFDTDVHHHYITRTSSSRFTITKAGSYLITFSGFAVGTTSKRIEVWLRVNDNDVDNSNTPYMFKGTSTIGLVAVSFIQHFDVGDYFEFWTWGDDTSCKWDATAAGTSPTRPAIPSIIITANYLSSD